MMDAAASDSFDQSYDVRPQAETGRLGKKNQAADESAARLLL
jgi:hypothetical protein